IRVAENVESLRVGLHEAVLDAVVDHLDEVAGAGGTAVEIALFCRALHLFAAGRARDVAAAGSEDTKDRIQPFHRGLLTADHQAVSALETPDASARADIEIVN